MRLHAPPSDFLGAIQLLQIFSIFQGVSNYPLTPSVFSTQTSCVDDANASLWRHTT